MPIFSWQSFESSNFSDHLPPTFDQPTTSIFLLAAVECVKALPEALRKVLWQNFGSLGFGLVFLVVSCLNEYGGSAAEIFVDQSCVLTSEELGVDSQ